MSTKDWLQSGLSAHVEKQMSIAFKIEMSEGVPTTEVSDLVRPYMKSRDKKSFKALIEDNTSMIAADIIRVEKAVSMLSQPRMVAKSLGFVEENRAKFRRYNIIGRRHAVFCTKHCSGNSLYTRGYQFGFETPKGYRCTKVLCEKCVRELGDPKNRGRLASLLGLKSNKSHGNVRNRGSDKRPESRPNTRTVEKAPVETPKVSGFTPIPPEPPKIDPLSLSLNTVAQLKAIANDLGIVLKSTARKADYVAAVQGKLMD